MSTQINGQIIMLSMIRGVLWLTEGDYSKPHDQFENDAVKGSVINWLYAPGFGIDSFTAVTSGDAGLFIPPGPQPVQYTIKGVALNGFSAIVGDPTADPGSYTLTVNGQVWDPKIRVVSDDGINNLEKIFSALVNA